MLLGVLDESDDGVLVFLIPVHIGKRLFRLGWGAQRLMGELAKLLVVVLGGAGGDCRRSLRLSIHRTAFARLTDYQIPLVYGLEEEVSEEVQALEHFLMLLIALQPGFEPELIN